MAEVGKTQFTIGPQRRNFESHYSTAFIEYVRGRLHKEAEAFAAYVYDLPRARWEYKNLAQRIIVECLIEGFPQRLNDPVVSEDWPVVRASLNADRTLGRLDELSWSPETDALRGGSPIDAVDFKVKAAPPNAARRIISTVLNAFKRKTVGDDMDPVGTPTGQPASSRLVDRDAPKATPQPAARTQQPKPSAPPTRKPTPKQ